MTPPLVERWIRTVASMREPPQTMAGSAREIFTSWKLLIEPQVVDEMAERAQLPPKFVERQTPSRPTAQSSSGAWRLLAILAKGPAC